MGPSKYELMTLNRCRLYLQVLFLSEICTGDGLYISGDAWTGNRLDIPLKQSSWPRQQKSSSQDWSIWQTYLKKAFLSRGLRLQAPLGNWLHCDDRWEWYFSPSHGCLYKLELGQWMLFSSILKRDRLPAFSASGTPSPPPSDLHRATIYFRRSQIICTGFAPISNNQSPQVTTFSRYLQLSEPGESWCFSHLDLSDDGHTLATAIKEGDAIAISNGSFRDQYGTAAWVLEGSNSNGRIVGAVIAPGTAKDQSAYRSELVGIYSILLCVKKLCNFFHITQGCIELGCDGQSALDKAFNHVALIKIEDSNYDLLFAIRTLWAYSPLTWKFCHVKGHQDDHSPQEHLDRWARLNIEMDKRAKGHIEIA
jgi:hypothetical protein